ncbi:acyltransferase family protein [Pedobacter cryoconitis]|uniref:Putative acyltransferase n=1 Tax=Pedobacter cryoconitis TaxID=188932 RepID=A0A7X0J3J6_9SPHI|nr:heparan-alpha-glucosaminide N-acetyltransferase domain-containing protein [Pedobacter cryoconitis]MBB6500459.1 putative acyltransferase [Pedobacter cryoconitis]
MKPLAERFLSLDVFRGMTLCFMIIVNTPGRGANPFGMLLHASWHGFTPTDLVFPSFLFAVGNAMSFSMKRFSQMDNAQVLLKIFKRTILIFLIGYLMYWFPFFKYDKQGHAFFAVIENTRIMGVLQRIALCFCIASLMIHYLSGKTVIWLSVLFLVGYWIILQVFGDAGAQFTMMGNIGSYIDKSVLGESHLYHGDFFHGKHVAFDPEGILSTIPAIVNVVIGYFAGKFIQEKGKGYESIARLFLVGSLLVLIAICWNTVFPVNKKLWTSSFVLLTCGLDLMIIGALLYIIEVKQSTQWTKFFVVFGKNPLFIYIVSEVLLTAADLINPKFPFTKWINLNFFQVVAPGPVGSLLFALCFMLVCWLVGYILDRRKIYIRV